MSRPEVGPNAISRLIGPLRQAVGAERAQTIFALAGLERALTDPPQSMVSERAVAALFAALQDSLAQNEAERVLRQAGQDTADYVIANRIPPAIRRLLPIMPTSLAMRLLLGAIQRHAWTFAGSGRCRAHPGRPAVIEIEGNPLATPGCPWHGAVFLRMFRRLVHTDSRLDHTTCCALGAPVCRYEIYWRR